MGIVTPVRASILATALGAASILSKSLAPINGDHSWRQADAYAQILGMMGRRGLGPLSTFDGPPAMFDVPLYQALVAGLALVTGAEPLVVVRFVDAGLWAVLESLSRRGSDEGRRRALRLFLGTGVLGGYTTYSALSVDSVTLATSGHLTQALAYAVGTLLAGLVAAAAGIVLAARLPSRGAA